MKTVCLAICFCYSAVPAAAQFVLQSTVPDDGSTDVPIESVIRFDFSNALNTANDFARSIVVKPRDAISISQVALLVRDLSRPAGPDNPPAVVEFTVRHQPDTDYSWLVYAVYDADGEFVETPYTLRYTTASDIGSLSVSGTVSEVSPAKRGVVSEATRSHLRTAFERVLEHHKHAASPELTRQVLPDASGWPGAGSAKRGSSASLGPHTQVLLLSDFDVRRERQDVLAAGVLQGVEGSYRIDRVRPGEYWPIAVRYTDATHQTIEAIGFFDAEGDHVPSPIMVGSDEQEVDLIVFPFAPSTARERLSSARAAVDQLGIDPAPRLQLIDSNFGGRTDGTAYGWTYRFYDGVADTLITVYSDPLGEDISQELATSTSQRIVEPLDGDFLDSDEALDLALERGGEDFIARYPPENIVVTMLGGNRHWLFEEHERTQFWDIHILATSTSGVDQFEIRLDMTTGETISVGTGDEIPLPGQLVLGPIYPNPAAANATIPFTLDRSTDVRLSVHDVLGRRVATLIDAVMAAGDHDVRWDASNLPAGAYVFYLVAGGVRESRPLVVAP